MESNYWLWPDRKISKAESGVLRETHNSIVDELTRERRAVLVYQAGFANVFEVTSFNMSDYGRDARRLMQHAFGPCEHFAQGLAAAGWLVATAWCNEAGDISNSHWHDSNRSDAPFSDSFRPVFSGVIDPDSEQE